MSRVCPLLPADSLYFLPGPTRPSDSVLSCYSSFVGSSDLFTKKFGETYDEVGGLLRELLTVPLSSSIIIMSGEAMLSLWSCLSSTLVEGDKVLAINSGLYGKGIGEMAKSYGATVTYFDTEPNTVFNIRSHWQAFKSQVETIKPDMITLVHCETPTGTLVSHTALEAIGSLCQDMNCLFYVDMVSSAGGVPIDVTSNKIDLALLGSQKCFSLHSDLSMVVVTEKAWNKMKGTKPTYAGYDALLPWREVVDPNGKLDDRLFPYTMNWSSMMALKKVLESMKEEGFDNVYQRHKEAGEYCRKRIVEMDLQLLTDPFICSPTVTAIQVPEHIAWNTLNIKLQERGVFFGRNYGIAAGKVFRIGHMGTQTNVKELEKALDILQEECGLMGK